MPSQEEVRQSSREYLNNLLATDPFAYKLYYGDVPPQSILAGVPSGGIVYGGQISAGLMPAAQASAGLSAQLEQARAEDQRRTAAAAGSNVLPTSGATGGAAGPTAYEELSGLLPSGFEASALPSTFADPFVESAFAGKKQTAQDFLENMFKRGTIGPTGKAAGLEALSGQEAGVRGSLGDIAKRMLTEEQAKLRGIAGEGYTAAGSLPGSEFDPTPYKGRVDTELASFTGGFPEAYGGAAGGVAFDTSALGSAGGAVTGPQNLVIDPYAQEGGKVRTGLEEEPAPPEKKRTTAVF